jgi:hypothetical protein
MTVFSCRFDRLPPALVHRFATRQALKIISGMQNFDPVSTAQVVQAAQLGGADYVDIACDPALVSQAKTTGLPVCVSAVHANAFTDCVRAGADLLEIGNYDSLYAQGVQFSAGEILDMARQTRQQFPDLVLTVTVPHHLPLDRQAELAEQLQNLGVDMLQTEGGRSTHPQQGGILGLMAKAVPTLAATYTISRAVSIPVLCASGLSAVTAPLAIACGAVGIGVGSAVNQLQDEMAMIATVRSLREALTPPVPHPVQV